VLLSVALFFVVTEEDGLRQKDITVVPACSMRFQKYRNVDSYIVLAHAIKRGTLLCRYGGGRFAKKEGVCLNNGGKLSSAACLLGLCSAFRGQQTYSAVR